MDYREGTVLMGKLLTPRFTRLALSSEGEMLLDTIASPSTYPSDLLQPKVSRNKRKLMLSFSPIGPGRAQIDRREGTLLGYSLLYFPKLQVLM